MSTRCAATAAPLLIYFEGGRHTGASGIDERGEHAVTGGEIAIRVNGLQTYVRGTGREVRPQAAPNRVGVPPQNHRIDKPIAAAVGALILREALARPAIAIVRRRHIARQFLAPERPRLRGIGLQRSLLLPREPLRRPEDRGGLGGMLWRHVVWDGTTRLGTAQRQHLRSECRDHDR